MQGGRALFFALVLSCILHALAILTPLLGKPSPGVQLTPPSGTVIVALPVSPDKISTSAVFSPQPSKAIPDAETTSSGNSNLPEEPRNPSDGLDILPYQGLSYFTTDQLTKRPRAMEVAELDTETTRSIIASGAMILQLWIDDQGHVADAVIEQNDLPEIFVSTAISAFKQSRFTPGERLGKRVPTMMRIEVRYDDDRLGNRIPTLPN